MAIIEIRNSIVDYPAQFSLLFCRCHGGVLLLERSGASSVPVKPPQSVMPFHMHIVEDIRSRHLMKAGYLVRMGSPDAANVSIVSCSSDLRSRTYSECISPKRSAL